jgi:superfamily II DNA or RNA helicase
VTQDGQSRGGDLFIVDNSDSDWKVQRYLRDWTDIAHSFDIATGYFEIGALLGLDGQWQKLSKMRVLMGDTVSKSTKTALLDGISQLLDRSIEQQKETNDFLSGVPAIVKAIAEKQIECKVYTKNKFHAKAYITHGKHAVVGSSALVGSSNFTTPGLTTNVELNIQIRREVEQLQEWYERHWEDAEDVSADILKVIERHTREYMPFDVYAKSLQQFFRGHEMTAGEWEQTQSRLYPVLDHYQREGYQALMKIANQHGGAFLCDGVGLGKTLVGLMLIERLIMYDRKRVALVVPKAARKPVWEKHIEQYVPYVGTVHDFSNLSIFNHTDLLRGGEFPQRFERIAELADVIVIDEAHHFRNPGIREDTRYWKLYDICKGKVVFFLTATPVNNSLRDLQHMIEIVSQRQPDYFKAAPLGIHSLPGHFRKLEKDLEKILLKKSGVEDVMPEVNQVEAERVLFNDSLFRALVVQRSRAYVKRSQEQHGASKAIFPKREPPQVVKYNLRKTYGRLLDMVEKAFAREKPLFSLAMYYPLFYSKTPVDTTKMEIAFRVNRQEQLVRLIRILFLKRFESSAQAFEMSCLDLLMRMLAFLSKNSKTDAEKGLVQRWIAQHSDLITQLKKKQAELKAEEPDEENDDVITPEMLEHAEELSRDEYKVEEIVNETFLDMDQLVAFLEELKKFRPANDDKLKALVNLLKSDPALKEHKAIIFTEFMTTARYLRHQLEKAGISGLDEVDSLDERNRGEVIEQFAPYYNGLSSQELVAKKLKESRILISTDVLSEGLNLQDATRLINFDLHWNPVRLMQRIGRVDRRLNPDIESRILADHPDQKAVRGTVAYWNFLPPEELDIMLKLYQKVSFKTLRISKVFGIEGKKLLKPEDDFDALKDFTHTYEGTTSTVEEMRLEYQKMLQDNPGLEERLNLLPGRVFSGKEHPSPESKAVFFCYALPAPKAAGGKDQKDIEWTEESGYTQWYLFDLSDSKIVEGPEEIIKLVRSTPETPCHRSLPDATLSDIRKKVEKQIKNTYLKSSNAPQGVKPILKAWMELS